MSSSAQPFEDGYYAARYRRSLFRARGNKPILNRTRLRVLRRLVPRGELLDVGCGEGHFLRYAMRFYQASGIDVSRQGIEAARRNTGLDSLGVHAGETLPFHNGAFDVVTSFDVVEHMERPEAFFHDTYRVLRPGGVLLFSTPNPGSIGVRLKGKRSHVFTDPTHISVRPPEKWRACVAEAGFRVLRDGTDTLWDWPYLPLIPAQAQRLVFVALSHLLFTLDVVFPWALGENYVCLARRCA